MTARERYLQEVLGTLWPGPATASRLPRLARGPAGATEFIVFPTTGRAAMLLPRTPRRAAAGMLRSYKASADRKDRIALWLLALAARAGVTEALPDRVAMPAPGDPDADIVAYLRGVMHEQVVIGVYLGSPRANRKPVLQVLAPDGAVRAFGKVSVDPLTAALVRAEAAALEFLGSAGLAQLRAPRLLHHGHWRAHEVMLAEPFPGRRPARSLDELGPAMTEIAAVRGAETAVPLGSGYWQGLQGRLACAGRQDLAGPVLHALDQLGPAAGRTKIGFGSWHGDWTPWNMTMAGQRPLVWDWERFEAGVPVGYDALHYWLQGAIVRGGAEPAATAAAAMDRAPQILGRLGVDPGAAPLVAALYLVEIAARYLRDGQAEAGARLGQIDTWLLPALTRQAKLLSASPRPER